MFEIRYAHEDEFDAWMALWNEYLCFYKVHLPPEVSRNTWQMVHDPSRPYQMRVAVVNDRLAGFAIHQFQFSTWSIGRVCYLEDMLVSQKARGNGIGHALIDDLIEIAADHDCAQVYWHSRRDNSTARRLYDQYVLEDGNVRYRLNLVSGLHQVA